MATLSGLTTKLKGSAGDWTFYRRLGSTVAKQKIDRRLSGPATFAQLANRVAWANLVSFWSYTDGLLVGAFSRKGKGQTDYNAFMSHNLGVSDVYLTRGMVRRKACVVAPYCVSYGILPTVATEVAADGRIVSGILLSDDLGVGDTTTIGDFSRAVLTHNEGYSHGDIIVALAVEQTADALDGTPRAEVSSALVQLDACSPTPLSLTGSGAAAFTAIDGRLGASAPLYGGMTWIHLSVAAGTVKVSTQRLTLTGPPSAPDSLPHLPYTTPEARQQAIDSYRRDVCDGS